MIRPGKLAALLLLLLMPAPLAAQESCRIPERLEAQPCERRGETPRGQMQRGRPGDFDFYVLAFSWSPGFCASEAGRRSPGQCRDNEFGWVVHGLWPQYAKGRAETQPWPQHCAATQPLPPALMRRHFCAMPDARLMQCQWAKHGSCSGLAADAYFAAIDRLAARFAPPVPAADSQPAAAFRAAMLAARPELQARHLQVIRRDGRIREIRICLDKTLAEPLDCRG